MITFILYPPSRFLSDDNMDVIIRARRLQGTHPILAFQLRRMDFVVYPIFPWGCSFNFKCVIFSQMRCSDYFPVHVMAWCREPSWQICCPFLIICDRIRIYPMTLVYANVMWACVSACECVCSGCVTGPHGRAVLERNGFYPVLIYLKKKNCSHNVDSHISL